MYNYTLTWRAGMATLTISAPKELEKLKKQFPKTDWNEVMKIGILNRLKELTQFEKQRKK
jgi:hypothetical protein